MEGLRCVCLGAGQWVISDDLVCDAVMWSGQDV